MTRLDAVVAVQLVEASMQCTDGITNALHSQFVDDPDLDLQQEQQRIMTQRGSLQGPGAPCIE